VNEVGEIVQRRGITIDDGEQRAAAFCDDGKGRGGTNGFFFAVWLLMAKGAPGFLKETLVSCWL
jgi:hypothetical protein